MAAFGTVMTPYLAQYVAAYIVILLGWCAGVLIGVWKRDPRARMPVWAYVMSTLFASVGATASAASALAQIVPEVQVTALLFPVAMAIPAFPERWAEFGTWVLGRLAALRGVKQ